jgi:hypothetical protein
VVVVVVVVMVVMVVVVVVKTMTALDDRILSRSTHPVDDAYDAPAIRPVVWADNTVIPQFLEPSLAVMLWSCEAHDDAISSVEFVREPRSILTASGDQVFGDDDDDDDEEEDYREG